jgi:hypothetical protein
MHKKLIRNYGNRESMIKKDIINQGTDIFFLFKFTVSKIIYSLFLLLLLLLLFMFC